MGNRTRSRGRIRIAGDVLDWIQDALGDLSVAVASLEPAVAVDAVNLAWDHADPSLGLRCGAQAHLMPALDREVLAERVAAVEPHLARVAERLPPRPEDLQPASDASDAVILHLWQAVQVVIDVALALCVRQNLGTPSSYADAFDRLAAAGDLKHQLATRLTKAAGFRNLIAHAYDRLDMNRIHEGATSGPPDLRAFLRRARDLLI